MLHDYLSSSKTTFKYLAALEYLNVYCSLSVSSDHVSSLWLVVMALNTPSLLLSQLNFVSQVLYSVLKAASKERKIESGSL